MHFVAVNPVQFRYFYNRLRNEHAFFDESIVGYQDFPLVDGADRQEAWPEGAAEHFSQRPCKRYLDAIEWVFSGWTGPFSRTFRAGHVATRLYLAYLHVIPEKEKAHHFTAPDPRLFDDILSEWHDPNRPRDGQNFMMLWEQARDRLRRYDYELLLTIESLVGKDRTLSTWDRTLVLFAMGLFFLLLIESKEEMERTVQALGSASQRNAERTRTPRPSNG